MDMKRWLIASGTCGVLASAVSAALGAETEEVSEVVIVTGSYIRGTAEDAALPVDVISADDLERQGAPSTLELIKSLSVSAGVLGDTNQFDARAQGSEGSGSVNLRGFGPARTLVLLNGRRLATNPFVPGAVDTNIIPSSAIGRVEVLKDGAAATYGSDAIAGVVNFITKENLKGLDLGADYKAISDSDGDYGVNASYGWRSERTHLLLSAGYQHRSELLVKDRDWAVRDYLDSPQSGWSAAGNPSSFITLTPAFGVTGLLRDPNCATLGGFPGFVPGATSAAAPTPVCYWQYSPFDALTEKENRFQVFGSFEVDITDSTTFHAEGLYAETDVPIYRTSPSYAALQTPGSIATGGTSPVAGRYYVPASNPGFADFVAQNPTFPSSAGGAFIVANRPFGLGGNPFFGYDSSEGPRHYDAFRLSAGLNGEFAQNVGWDVTPS
jgi:iron complex outermembrane receptor protein